MIAIRNVTKNFRLGGETVSALHNVNVTIHTGEFVSVIGPSGSGKTTLLNIIGGLEQPEEGEVHVYGQQLEKLNDASLATYRLTKVGYVFQNFNLLARLTVLENVLVPTMLNKLPATDRLAAARRALKKVGLASKEQYLPNKLSGGERQRVAIARALINNPDLILADEPTGNLDEKNAQKIMDLLISVTKGEEKTLILVTHNPELAQRADRSIAMKNGKIVTRRGSA